MAILVTGGTGYIGSHTVVQLLEEGYELVILDNLSNSDVTVLKDIETITGTRPTFIEGDIRDYALLHRVFQQYPIEAVIHFAGLKAVGESVSKPIEYYDNNLSGTITLLKVMMHHHCKKMVFSSSATVYGLNEDVPFKEDHPLSTTNPYGATKLMIEEILRDLYESDRDFSLVLLRYFNPIGAHPSGLIGENPKGIPNNLLPYVAKVASGELVQLSVFGDDYETVDGTGVRDYIHVVDLANGHLKALDYTFKHKAIEAFNLGTGKGYSVLELIHHFKQASGKDIPYQVTGRRPGDIGVCYADPSKASELLDWQAQLSIESMCQDAWRYASNQR